MEAIDYLRVSPGNCLGIFSDPQEMFVNQTIAPPSPACPWFHLWPEKMLALLKRQLSPPGSQIMSDQWGLGLILTMETKEDT